MFSLSLSLSPVAWIRLIFRYAFCRMLSPSNLRSVSFSTAAATTCCVGDGGAIFDYFYATREIVFPKIRVLLFR